MDASDDAEPRILNGVAERGSVSSTIDARVEPGSRAAKPPRSARRFVRWHDRRVRRGHLHDERRDEYGRRAHARDRQRMTVEHGEQDGECRAAFDVATIDRRLRRSFVVTMTVPGRAVGATTLVADAVVAAATVRHRVARGCAREPQARHRHDDQCSQPHDGATEPHDNHTVATTSRSGNPRETDRSSQGETRNQCVRMALVARTQCERERSLRQFHGHRTSGAKLSSTPRCDARAVLDHGCRDHHARDPSQPGAGRDLEGRNAADRIRHAVISTSVIIALSDHDETARSSGARDRTVPVHLPYQVAGNDIIVLALASRRPG